MKFFKVKRNAYKHVSSNGSITSDWFRKKKRGRGRTRRREKEKEGKVPHME